MYDLRNRPPSTEISNKDSETKNSSDTARIGTKTYTHPQLGYTIEYPADWTRGEQDNPDEAYAAKTAYFRSPDYRNKTDELLYMIGILTRKVTTS